MSWETVPWSLVPTPGSTAGSMSRLIRRHERWQLLLVGDLTYGPSCSVGDRFPAWVSVVSWSRPQEGARGEAADA